MSAVFPAHVLRALAWLLGLPGRRSRAWIAGRLADRDLRRNSNRSRVVALNLRMIGAEPALARRVLVHTALTALEGLRFWTRPPTRNLGDVMSVEGLEHWAAAGNPRGVLVVAPHYGNWELLVQWLAAQGPMSLLYTRGRSAVSDAFLKLVRERHGVRAVPADAHGMKPLLKALQRGEVVGITPDQVPEGTGALWSPFFGHPALTMTLIHRLAERSGARLLLGAAERQADGRFVIRFAPLDAAVTSGPLQAGIDAMNLAVEAFVRRDLAQYQWTYKRFKGERPGGEHVNPYWPECY